MIHTNQHIKLVVTSTLHEQPGVYSIFFARPQGFDFDAGDWIDIAFEDLVLRGGITYSLSSSPTEPELRITFKAGISEVKRALESVAPGQNLYIAQYGNDYNFTLNENRSSTLIAGGIGIAPFRSMLKEMVDLRSKNDVDLIYLNQNEAYLFQAELDNWSRSLPGLTIDYIPTKSINREQREQVIKGLIKSVNRHFYISGPEAMVEATEHLLIDLGVNIKDIRIDSFGGY